MEDCTKSQVNTRNWKDKPIHTYLIITSCLCCRVNAFMLYVSYTVSVLSLILVSSHRYAKVCHPHTFHTIFAPRRYKVYCTSVWVLASVINLPLLGGIPASYGYDSEAHICNGRVGRKNPGYGSIAVVCLLIMTFSVISFSNVAIFRHWYRSRSKLQKRNNRMRNLLSMSVTDMAALDNCEYSRGESVVDESVTLAELLSRRCNPVVSATYSKQSRCTPSARDMNFKMNKNEAKPGLRAKASARRSSWPLTKAAADILMGEVRQSLIVTAFVHAEATASLDQSHNPLSQDHAHKLEEGSSKPPQRAVKHSSLIVSLNDLNADPISAVFPGTRATVSPKAVEEIILEVPNNLTTGTANWMSDAEEFKHMGEATRCSHSVPRRTPSKGKRQSTSIPRTRPYPCLLRRSQHSLAWRRDLASPSIFSKKRTPNLTLIRSLLLISVCLFLFHTPVIVTTILTFTLKERIPPEIPALSTLLVLVNCSLNWVVYGATNRTFRQAYTTTLKGWTSVFNRRDKCLASPSIGPASHIATKR